MKQSSAWLGMMLIGVAFGAARAAEPNADQSSSADSKDPARQLAAARARIAQLQANRAGIIEQHDASRQKSEAMLSFLVQMLVGPEYVNGAMQVVGNIDHFAAAIRTAQGGLVGDLARAEEENAQVVRERDQAQASLAQVQEANERDSQVMRDNQALREQIARLTAQARAARDALREAERARAAAIAHEPRANQAPEEDLAETHRAAVQELNRQLQEMRSLRGFATHRHGMPSLLVVAAWLYGMQTGRFDPLMRRVVRAKQKNCRTFCAYVCAASRAVHTTYNKLKQQGYRHAQPIISSFTPCKHAAFLRRRCCRWCRRIRCS